MDKYTKLAKIGKGSFGCAYLATRTNDPLAKKYVIKEIRMDPRDQQSALREAKLLAALDHPNIIGCKESFLLSLPPSGVALANGRAHQQQQQQVLCIVTEYADGGDLRKKLEQQIAKRVLLKEQEVLDLFVQVCLALKHLHDRKIIHRDIKPENIFLMQSNVVKLGDFGVATVLSNTLACAETMTGTPYYTSPEICMGKRYNSKTDIWSLGCVLYELVTFAHAFGGRSQRQLFDNIMKASFTPIVMVLGSSCAYSKRLSDLVGEMLLKNPRDRPSVNQIIKKPIVMERIQGFLSERVMADELNHTVLHGHHIFNKNKSKPAAANLPSPPPPPMRVAPVGAVKSPGPVKQQQCSADRAPQRAAAPRKARTPVVGKSPSVVLKKSRSFKKAAPIASPAAAVAASPPRYMTPMKTLEQKNRFLLQKKKAIVERAKQDALRARLMPGASASPIPPAASVPGAGAKNPQVADRISAFNAQWQAQRQQLLHNLPAPPPPSACAPGGALLPPSPPPAPTPIASAAPKTSVGDVEKKINSEYPKPVITAAPDDQNLVFVPPAAPISAVKIRKSPAGNGVAEVKAAAAKQRDAMRQDIKSRKQELLKKAGGVGAGRAKVGANGASPLDDPIILVQNLSDFHYQAMEPPPSSASNTAHSDSSTAATLVSPPPAPVSTVGSDSNTRRLEDGDEDAADDEFADEEEGLEEPEMPVNLEFERMVLQLKSVVESSDLDDEPCDSDDDELDRNPPNLAPHIPEETEDDLATVSPLPPAYDDSFPATHQLKVSILEDKSFMKALRTLLHLKKEGSGENDEAAILSAVASEQKPALLWMRNYVAALTSHTVSPPQQ